MEKIKVVVKSIPLVGPVAKKIKNRTTILLKKAAYRGSRAFWESRYASGGTSGPGSLGKLAEFKAKVLNSFARDYGIRSIIEFGCGDGTQLSLASYPAYVGLDVSKTAIQLCKQRFADDGSKSFFLYDPECFLDRHSIFRAELSVSIDVIFHLTEDSTFELYMQHLFAAAEKFVIIYSSDTDANDPHLEPHFRNRCFSEWVKTNLPEWRLLQRIPNEYPTASVSEFSIYVKG